MPDSFFTAANYIEAGFWTAVGLAFAGVALARPRGRGAAGVAAITFIAFGGSDVVEVQTGQWWDPWWLFVWKAICVVVLAGLLVHYERARKKR
jgi:hypothetical protein